jgi:hypothetical protein
MTFLEAVFVYEPPIGECELAAVNSMSDVYGIRLMKFDQQMNTVIIEYDASRLTKRDFEFITQCRHPP